MARKILQTAEYPQFKMKLFLMYVYYARMLFRRMAKWVRVHIPYINMSIGALVLFCTIASSRNFNSKIRNGAAALGTWQNVFQN